MKTKNEIYLRWLELSAKWHAIALTKKPGKLRAYWLHEARDAKRQAARLVTVEPSMSTLELG